MLEGGAVAGLPLVGVLAGAVIKAGVHHAVVALREELLLVGLLQVLASVPLVILEAVVFVIPIKAVAHRANGLSPPPTVIVIVNISQETVKQPQKIVRQITRLNRAIGKSIDRTSRLIARAHKMTGKLIEMITFKIGRLIETKPERIGKITRIMLEKTGRILQRICTMTMDIGVAMGMAIIMVTTSSGD